MAPSAGAAPVTPADLDRSRIPRHIAIIMDGNGRWAKARSLPRVAGHKVGVESVEAVVRAAGDLGVEALTLYTFSTENWSRPEDEVSYLMQLLIKTFTSKLKSLDENNVRLRVSGRVSQLPASVRSSLDGAVRALAGNTGLILNLALNYGSRQEIVDAVNKLLAEGKTEVSEADLSSAMYSPDLPDPELMIRTSGEQRISNFLLWQLAYTEFYITDVLWPDFREPDLVRAVYEYQKRDRRFGGV